MKKLSKRLLSLLLCLVLIGTSGVTAMAATKSNSIAQYQVYTALGDSQTAGYGLEAYYDAANNQENRLHGNADGQRIPGSYVDQIANAVGAETVNCCAHSGWRIQELLYALKPQAYDAVYDSYLLCALNRVSREKIDEAIPLIAPAIKNADLITLQFGQNDIITSSLIQAFDYLHGDLGGFNLPDIKGIEDLASAFAAAASFADEMGKLSEFINRFRDCLDKNSEVFKEYLPILINTIREMNPSADIVVLGVNNPLTTTSSVAIFDLLDIRLAKVNNYIKNECPCRDEYSYCDISATTNYGIQVLDWDQLLSGNTEELKYTAVRMIHATEKGHNYIAKQIQKLLVKPVARVSYGLLNKTQVKWDRVSGALRYNIYRSTDGVSYQRVGSSLNTTYIDLKAPRGTTCYYTVRAVMDISGGMLSLSGDPVSIVPIR